MEYRRDLLRDDQYGGDQDGKRDDSKGLPHEEKTLRALIRPFDLGCDDVIKGKSEADLVEVQVVLLAPLLNGLDDTLVLR